MPTSDRFPAGGFPAAWYAIRPSSELRPGGVESVHYFGRDLVLYRTESGEARLVDAVCPHLGAHLGLGSIEGEDLVCAMHGFAFGGDGQCSKLAYGTRPPPKARLHALPVREVNGFVFAWYSPVGAEPAFTLEALDWEGWMRPRHRRIEFAGHPQETTENSVDIGHFSQVHHYETSVEAAPEVDGAKLTATYRLKRPIFGPRDRIFSASAIFAVLAHGLGYSLVEVEVLGTPIRARLYINATPIDGERIHLNIAASVKKTLPGLNLLAREAVFYGLGHDVSQDIPFWEGKRYLDRPILADGDGPIPVYRRWCRQFYEAELPATAPGAPLPARLDA